MNYVRRTKYSGKNDVVAAERHESAVQLLYAVLEHGGLFVQTDDVFSIGDDILLAVEILNFPKLFLPTKVAWINPASTSSKPKGVGLAFTKHENCLKVKDQIEVELGSTISGSRPTFTM